MKRDGLRKMCRKELLELLVMQSKDNDYLKKKLEETERMLVERQWMVERAISIAEASLQINSVYEAARTLARQTEFSQEESFEKGTEIS